MFNKKDKEYLQKNIEKKIDDLDKKVESVKANAQKTSSTNNTSKEANKNSYENLRASDPNSPIGKRLTELYKDKARQDDRDKLIAALEEKQTQGEATLAEKIELMNLNLQKSLPKDFVDGVRSMGDTMKKGASQMGAGMNVITQKLMMSNPLTAMLYQNRALFGAVGNIGVGALRMGWGALQGIGAGTGSMLRAAIGFGRKRKEANTSNDGGAEEGRAVRGSVLSGDETSEGVVEASEGTENLSKFSVDTENGESGFGSSTAKKISELHDLFFKEKTLKRQEEEEKKKQSILSKGLSGLGNTMKSVSEFTNIMMAKQKLILGAVILGGVAILGLAAWFKSGGMSKLLDGVMKKIGGAEVEKGIDNAENYLNEQRATVKERANELNEASSLLSGDTQNVFNIDESTLQGNPASREIQRDNIRIDNLKNMGLGENTAARLTALQKKGAMGLASGTATKTRFTNTVDLKLPYDTKVVSILSKRYGNTLKDDNPDLVEFQLVRVVSGNMVGLIFTHALKNSVTPGAKPKGTLIAKLAHGCVILGDVKAFLGIKDGVSIEEAIAGDMSANSLKEYNKQLTDGLGPVNSGLARRFAPEGHGNMDTEAMKEALLQNPNGVASRLTDTNTKNQGNVNSSYNSQSANGDTTWINETDNPITINKIPSSNLNQSNVNDNRVTPSNNGSRDIRNYDEWQREFGDVGRVENNNAQFTTAPVTYKGEINKDAATTAEVMNVEQFNAATSKF